MFPACRQKDTNLQICECLYREAATWELKKYIFQVETNNSSHNFWDEELTLLFSDLFRTDHDNIVFD